MSSREKIISDFSKSQLTVVPEDILNMTNLKMLFLEGNMIKKLPYTLFSGLPNLMWLDLRNNILESLPRTIADHPCLENLLLSNNKLKRLPNELGLVPNLKALQIQNNPLVYPFKEIIEEGTKAIKRFLKEQYDIQYKKLQQIDNGAESRKRENRQSASSATGIDSEDEVLVKVVEESRTSLKKVSEIDRASSYWNPDIVAVLEKPQSRESRGSTRSGKEVSFEKLSHNKLVTTRKPPPLYVKKIELPIKKPKKQEEAEDQPLKIIHKINKSDSKISLKSYFSQNGISKVMDRIPENSLKEGWLNKLKILLNDQERILQQERNLRALAAWRDQHPQNTPKTFYDDEFVAKKVTKYPYDTDPAYSKIPSREELAKQLNQFLSNEDVVRSPSMPAANRFSIDLDRMISDLMEQLKEMESVQRADGAVTRSEMDHAEKQIQTIVKIHKELLKLKAANDTM